MKKFLLIFIIFLALFINIFPNYYAYLNTPKGYSFLGQASWFDPWDLNVYVSAIRWGQQGNILLENLYTSLPNPPILMYPLYTLAGFFNKNINPFLFFYFLSLIFGALLILLVWILLKPFLTNYFRFLALFFIIFGGGLGWLFFPNFQSADLYITGFTFISQLQRAHEAFGISLYLTSLVCFYLFTLNKKIRFNIISLCSLIILIVFYPYYIFSYILICGSYSLLKFLRNNDKISIKFLFINLIISIPILLIYYNHINSNQTFSSVFSQKLSTPNIIEILSGYGILFLLVLFQVKTKKLFPGKLFLNLWFFISIFISYLPMGFARFYLRGLFFPLVILAVYGLINLSKSQKKIKLIILCLVFIVPISTFFIFFKRIDEVKNINPWYYLPNSAVKILDEIPLTKLYSQNMLSFYQMGNYIPTQSIFRVYFGHLIQTPDSSEKIQNLIDFYGNNYDEKTALKFLKKNYITYVYYGMEEQNLTIKLNQSDKLNYRFLIPKFKNNFVTIFSY